MNDIVRCLAANEAHAMPFAGLLLASCTDFSPTESNGAGQERARRVRCAVPVNLGSAVGIVRDISTSGVYFETDATFPLLSPVLQFELELYAPTGRVAQKCVGEVVRVEPLNKRVGVAVKLIEPVSEPSRID